MQMCTMFTSLHVIKGGGSKNQEAGVKFQSIFSQIQDQIIVFLPVTMLDEYNFVLYDSSHSTSTQPK